MLSSVLAAAGYRTGVFTSPALRSLEESVKINGRPAADEKFARAVGRVADAAKGSSDPPTEFELLTASAFEYFKESECDVAVIEAGLGGRLDATNVIKRPLLSVITGISLDHTAVLGDDERAIAREKAGIIKRGAAVTAGRMADAALAEIKERADALSCPLAVATGDRFSQTVHDPSGSSFYAEPYGTLRINLAGTHQTDNAAVALAAAETLREKGFRIPDRAIAEGLANARADARFETLRRDPPVIFDGAHNPDGIRALTENINALLGGRVILVFGVMGDKNYAEMIKTLAPSVRYAFTVRPSNPRSLDPSVSAALFEEAGVIAEARPAVGDGIAAAAAKAEETGLPVLIAGSLYSYAEATDALGKKP